MLFHIDEIRNLLTQPLLQTADCDLTERYSNVKLLYYLRNYLVEMKRNRFCEQPVKQQLMEQTATIAAQWFQPRKNVSYSRVKASLDHIALEVLNFLRHKHPNHSIFLTSTKYFSYWKDNNIDDNHWNEAEGTQIMDTLEKYIFGELNFRLPKSRNVKVEYKCIDNVLENKIGEGIILFIIYHSVARRLGLRCDIGEDHGNTYDIKSRISFLMFWQPKYAINANRSENINRSYFSIRNGINKFSDCLHKKPYLVWDRDLRLFTAKSILEDQLKVGIFPNFTIYDISMLKNFYDKIKSRSQEVKFAVGMIVTHGDQSTNNSTGVIIGWHRININLNKDIFLQEKFSKNCSHFVSPSKIYINYSATEQEIYYAILSDDNEICYVEQGTISLTIPKWIDNDETGRYFSKFENTHYVPNEMLAKVYPQDAA
ncbi:F-box only protein 21-like isoform X2 [Polyergus mexicanus]